MCIRIFSEKVYVNFFDNVNVSEPPSFTGCQRVSRMYVIVSLTVIVSGKFVIKLSSICIAFTVCVARCGLVVWMVTTTPKYL